MDNESLIAVLLIEDDLRLAELTKEYLEQHNIVVSIAADGDKGLQEAVMHSYDAILLDLMLPGRDGISVCQRIRENSDVPIIMITARGEEADRILGLELGADDYLPKPFSPRELLARLRAVLRRSKGFHSSAHHAVKRGDLQLDPGTFTAKLNDQTLDLTSYEFHLLLAMAERAGQVLSRERLMELARGNAEEAFDRSIDVHISRLRQKLGDDPRNPTRIRTIRGVGYLFLSVDMP